MKNQENWGKIEKNCGRIEEIRGKQWGINWENREKIEETTNREKIEENPINLKWRE